MGIFDRHGDGGIAAAGWRWQPWVRRRSLRPGARSFLVSGAR